MSDLFWELSGAAEAVRFVEEHCQVGVFEWDVSSDKMHWSSGLFALFGLADGSIEPSLAATRRLVHPHDRLTDGQLSERIEAGLPFERTIRIVRGDGRVRWLSVRCEFALDSSGKARQLIGIAKDITAQMECGHRDRIRADRFRTMVSSVAPIVLSADADGLVREADGWTDVTGKSEGAAFGMNWIDALHANERAATHAAWRHAVETGDFFDRSLRLLQADGSYRWYRACCAPRVTADGTVVNWTGLVIDTRRGADVAVVEERVSHAQIRASRALLKWSVADLARASGLTAAVIRRLEASDQLPPARSQKAIRAVRRALEAAGVEFVHDAGAAPGVRPTDRMRRQGSHRGAAT